MRCTPRIIPSGERTPHTIAGALMPVGCRSIRTSAFLSSRGWRGALRAGTARRPSLRGPHPADPGIRSAADGGFRGHFSTSVCEATAATIPLRLPDVFGRLRPAWAGCARLTSATIATSNPASGNYQERHTTSAISTSVVILLSEVACRRPGHPLDLRCSF